MAAVEDRCSAARLELERLYEAHGARVRTICRALLRDRDDADDAAQQVFLSALRALQNGTVPRDGGAWLATIARRECWSRVREPAAAPLHAGLRDLRAEDPSAAAVRRVELTDTWRTIAQLPERQREAFLLREVRGLAYEEVAERLRLSHPSVRSLLRRARNTLRTQLERGAAALGGTQWLNLLTRLVGDGSNPAVSSVARTTAVGLGALALTGGAVVAPRLAADAHKHHLTARHAVVAPPALVAAVLPAPPRRTKPAAVRNARVVRRVVPAGDRPAEVTIPPAAPATVEGSSAGESHETSGRSTSSDQVVTAPTTTTASPADTSGGRGPDGSSPNGSSVDGSGPDGSTSGGPSSDGSGSDDGTQATAVATVTTATSGSTDGGTDGGGGSSGSDGSGSSSGPGSTGGSSSSDGGDSTRSDSGT